MKKIFAVLIAGLMISAQVWAVTVQDVCGQFDGDLNIGGQNYPNKSVYLLPGTENNTVTFVLPDFTFNSGKLGNIVLPNIPMDANGQLTLENATLYLDSISERATITVLNGLEDEGVTYNSIVTATEAMVLLSIAAPSLPEPILVLFAGETASNKNYALPNGGFEGEWTNSEPEGWHSFYSATGLMVDFIRNNHQFIRATDVRPGSAGTQSAMMSSDLLFGVKANGNCTNGQINAGSMTADDASANYNFSDPGNNGFNTPFNGHPDSIVFWAKYLPADRNADNEANRARMNTVITANARYQDPEATDYSAVKIASAAINYAATANMGWQRVSVPFEYTGNEVEPAYILTTFSTNQQPGGGSSYATGSGLNKKNVLDTVYLDDIQLIYKKELDSFTRDNEPLVFSGNEAQVNDYYCDDCAKYDANTDGLTSQAFIAFDATNKCICIYVIADDYPQSRNYSLYRVKFTDSTVEEALHETESEGQHAVKVMRNGIIYIQKGHQLYDIYGRPVVQ